MGGKQLRACSEENSEAGRACVLESVLERDAQAHCCWATIEKKKHFGIFSLFGKINNHIAGQIGLHNSVPSHYLAAGREKNF